MFPDHGPGIRRSYRGLWRRECRNDVFAGKGVRTTGRASQRKGRAAELELSRILQGHGYDVEPGRALSYGEVPDLSGLPGVHIECKRAETLRLSDWMAQAERDAQRFGDGAPAVFFRRSRSPWCVVMKLEDWMGIYNAQGCRCGGHCSAGEKQKC